MRKWALVMPLVVLSWSMVGCSDDAGGGPDLAVDIGVYEASIADLPSPDLKKPVEAGTDLMPADTLVGVDSGGLELTINHTGWQKTSCTSCHKLPPFAGVDAGTKTTIHASYTQSWQCALCHGGNGACAPNDPQGSSKTDHVNTDNCSTCHGQKHGYPTLDACLGCHFAGGPTATKGKVPCP